MAVVNLQARSIETLAEDYARSRGSRRRPVSIVAAIRAIRTVAPDTPFSDKELANIIAACAVRYGHAVEFDLSGNDVAFSVSPAVDAWP